MRRLDGHCDCLLNLHGIGPQERCGIRLTELTGHCVTGFESRSDSATLSKAAEEGEQSCLRNGNGSVWRQGWRGPPILCFAARGSL